MRPTSTQWQDVVDGRRPRVWHLLRWVRHFAAEVAAVAVTLKDLPAAHSGRRCRSGLTSAPAFATSALGASLRAVPCACSCHEPFATTRAQPRRPRPMRRTYDTIARVEHGQSALDGRLSVRFMRCPIPDGELALDRAQRLTLCAWHRMSAHKPRTSRGSYASCASLATRRALRGSSCLDRVEASSAWRAYSSPSK